MGQARRGLPAMLVSDNDVRFYDLYVPESTYLRSVIILSKEHHAVEN